MALKNATTLNSKVPELMGAKEVAAELDVAVSNLDKIPRLPEATQRIGAGRIWRADVIREFADDRRKRKAE